MSLSASGSLMPLMNASTWRPRISSCRGRNSCSGGSSSRMVTGSPSIASRMPDEVGALQGEQRLERGLFLFRRLGEDHPLHGRQPVAEEHVLGAAEADALRAELARLEPRPRAGRRWRAPSSCGSSSAQPSTMPNGPVGSGVTTGTSPTTTSPVPPLIEMTSPSCTVDLRPAFTTPPTSRSTRDA